jgi:putative ABC transport system permease protein
VRFRDRETTVVGIARDAAQASPDGAVGPFLYLPLAQIPDTKRFLLVRADHAVGAAVIAAARALDARTPVPRVSTLDEDAQIVLFPQRAAAIVTGGLGAIGVLLAALGLYGTVSASVARRTREIGLRIALGAERGHVLRGIVGEGARLALIGVGVGGALAALTMPLAAPWLFGVSPRDRVTYAVMAIGLLLAALAASYVPARRAASVDPLTALRTD